MALHSKRGAMNASKFARRLRMSLARVSRWLWAVVSTVNIYLLEFGSEVAVRLRNKIRGHCPSVFVRTPARPEQGAESHLALRPLLRPQGHRPCDRHCVVSRTDCVLSHARRRAHLSAKKGRGLRGWPWRPSPYLSLQVMSEKVLQLCTKRGF